MAKLVDKLTHEAAGVTVDIRLEVKTGQFEAYYQNKRYTADSLKGLKGDLMAAIEGDLDATIYPVILVKAQLGPFGDPITVERFAVTLDEPVRMLRWHHYEASQKSGVRPGPDKLERYTPGADLEPIGEGESVIFAEGGGATARGARAYIPYTDNAWLMAQYLKSSLTTFKRAVADIIGDGFDLARVKGFVAGVETIAAVKVEIDK